VFMASAAVTAARFVKRFFKISGDTVQGITSAMPLRLSRIYLCDAAVIVSPFFVQLDLAHFRSA